MTPLLLTGLLVAAILLWERDLRRAFLACIVCIAAMGLLFGGTYLILRWLAGSPL